jgi:hypothetical protein
MKINNPTQPLPKNYQKVLFGVFFGLTIVLILIFGMTGGSLNTDPAPLGIISFELAGSVEVAESIISSWDDDARALAAFGLGLDFLFIPVYAGALTLGCALSSRSIEKRSWPLPQLGNPLAWGVCLAGLLDVIENVSLLMILFGEAAAPWPQIAATCAMIKFSLIFLALVFTLYGGVVSLVIRE